MFVAVDLLDPQQAKIDGHDSDLGPSHQKVLRLQAGVVDDTKEYNFSDGWHIRDRLSFLNVGAAWDLSFEYELVSGGMDFSEENAQRIGEISQVSVERSAGGQFFQPNSKFRQVAGPNS